MCFIHIFVLFSAFFSAGFISAPLSVEACLGSRVDLSPGDKLRTFFETQVQGLSGLSSSAMVLILDGDLEHVAHA